MNQNLTNARVCVIQHGARHRYAIPRIMHSIGCLQKLVTDSHSESLLGRASRVASVFIELPSQAKRLSQRIIVGVPKNQIYCTDRWTFLERKLQTLSTVDMTSWLKQRDKAWFNLTKNTLPASINVIYVMGGENLAILKYAKDKGIKIIVDAFITPLNLRQTFKAKCEEGLTPTRDETEYAAVEAHYKEVFELSDIILCPSNWVAEGVCQLSYTLKSKIRICPYGSSLGFHSLEHSATPGRIFWAGGDWFRKGLHHLAAAADILKPKFPDMDFRVAGITDSEVIHMRRFRNLHFLGKLNRLEMEREFTHADIFVLPTLSEGMASVVVEALSFGCPVITTIEAGIDGLEEHNAGITVPANDPAVLAATICDLYQDRNKLAKMSLASKLFSANFNEHNWTLRLKSILNEVIS